MSEKKFIVEQITENGELIFDYDQSYSKKEINEEIKELLGEENIEEIKIKTRYGFVDALIYKKTKIMYFKNISYLGNPHPVYKKRIQIPKKLSGVFENYDEVHIMGFYKYKKNFFIVDFDINNKDRDFNNSSVHVYTNDFYQATKHEKFSRLDKNKNKITVLRACYLKKLLDGNELQGDNLLDIFEKFNKKISTKQWIKASEAITYMHKTNPNGNWRQAEWFGFFLETKFEEYIKENDLESIIEWTASSHKSTKKKEFIDERFDFDMYFKKEEFYGDLKASDASKKDAPGNDEKTLQKCLKKHKKLWYIIFEHDTIKDKDIENESYPMTRFRSSFLNQHLKQGAKKTDELSYKNRMKNSVQLKKMLIIELNEINYSKILSDFNQGKQPSGAARDKKVLINKIKAEDDNVVIFRYLFD